MKCRPFRGSNATIVPKRPVPMQSICPSLLTSMFPQFSSNIHACVYVVHSTELSFPRSAINAPKHGYVSPENFHSKTTSSLALQPNQAADQNGGSAVQIIVGKIPYGDACESMGIFSPADRC